MNIDINSIPDCQDLIERIRQTLVKEGYKISSIGELPKPFPKNDAGVLEGLSRAILTRQANWASIEKILPDLRSGLLNYDVDQVAALTTSDIGKFSILYKSKVKARFFEEELIAIYDNSKTLQQIKTIYGSVCVFIKDKLPKADYDASKKCFIRPSDTPLMKLFIDSTSTFKLSRVGLPICCEFFNNIGIDEFKPDVNTISFLNRINIDRTKVNLSRKTTNVRTTGISIAETLKKPRKYVDNNIWVFCAEDRGEMFAYCR